MFRRLFQRKSIELLLAEMAGEHRLHRVLGPVSLTSLGVGAIIGAGIFAMTGEVAADDAGPAIMVSFVVAGVACALAAFCYSEFAAMAPVAGSAYTYTYATLGELVAWIIGWDLILEYAMSCAVVAAHWAKYLNKFVVITLGEAWKIPEVWLTDPFSKCLDDGVERYGYCNLPALIIMAVVTAILVVGIRQSAVTNAVLVIVKVVVVVFVIVVGAGFVDTAHWNSVPIESRKSTDMFDYVSRHPELAREIPPGAVTESTTGNAFLAAHPELAARLTAEERIEISKLKSTTDKWGVLGLLGVKQHLQPIDDRWRSPFFPYGLSGVMIGAALVFFAYIGFDSISTHSEEAIRPQRDVPLAILLSLAICTVLYMLVAAVITGMEAYPEIDTGAALATAFARRASVDQNPLLSGAAWLIALGALAGMTSVLLVTFLSQARIFLAMARDGLLPHSIFGVVHPRFRTPHRSTMLTGALIALTAGFSPISALGEMVSIGTLMAFVLVCGAVLMLRITRPEVERPFRCPALYLVAPAGIFVSLAMMLFLPLNTWLRLVIWLAIGMVIYFAYGLRHSKLGRETERQLHVHGASPTDAPLDS